MHEAAVHLIYCQSCGAKIKGMVIVDDVGLSYFVLEHENETFDVIAPRGTAPQEVPHIAAAYIREIERAEAEDTLRYIDHREGGA